MRHLHVHHHQVGPDALREADRLGAVARLADDLVAGALDQRAQVHADDRLVLGDQHPHRATHLTVARVPGPAGVRSSDPPRSSRASDPAILRPRLAWGSNAAGRPGPRSRTSSSIAPLSRASRTRDVAAAVLEGVGVQLAEDQCHRRRRLARHLDRLQHRVGRLGTEAVSEHRGQAADEVGQVDLAGAARGQQVVHLGDRQHAVDGVFERAGRVAAAGAQPQQRGDRLEVVLDAVVDLLGDQLAHHAAAGLDRRGRLVGDRPEQRPLLRREPAGPQADQRADGARLPHQRHGQRALLVRRRAAGQLDQELVAAVDVAVALRDVQAVRRDEHQRTCLGVHGAPRGGDDLGQRLRLVQRLRHGLGDARQRLQLGDAAARPVVELRVLDRLRHLGRDRLEQLDLVVVPLPRLGGAHVHGAGEALRAIEDRHREQRLEPLLVEAVEAP